MEDHLYRFRTASRLLNSIDGSTGELVLGELEKLEIYFASPEQFNDPLEGYKNVHWSGDFIVWKNLIRHYLICHAWQYLKNVDPDIDDEDKLKIDINCTMESFDEELKTPLTNICTAFFSAPLISEYISTICRNNRIVQKTELEVHFTFLHPIIRHVTQKILFTHGYLHKSHCPTDQGKNHYFNPIIKTLEAAPKMSDEALASFFEVTLFENLKEDTLTGGWKKPRPTMKEGDLFLGIQFPEAFCSNLEKLMYPSWYAACFMKSCDDSSLWGTYGDGHKGVCLKFKVHRDKHGSSLDLSLRGSKVGAQSELEFTKSYFHKVDYEKGFLDVNFFISMSCVDKTNLYEHWYTGPDGSLSVCESWLQQLGGVETVRHRENFNHSYTSKLEAWHKEQEYRLVLDSDLDGIDESTNRKIQYSINNLEGVIFGIRTPLEQKAQILDILAKHAKKAKAQINVYQARYDKQTNTIKHAKLKALNLLDET